ncbi:MAG: hypothetical protein ABI647_26990 [Gemmatimonadota bacterium]
MPRFDDRISRILPEPARIDRRFHRFGRCVRQLDRRFAPRSECPVAFERRFAGFAARFVDFDLRFCILGRRIDEFVAPLYRFAGLFAKLFDSLSPVDHPFCRFRPPLPRFDRPLSRLERSFHVLSVCGGNLDERVVQDGRHFRECDPRFPRLGSP